MSQSQQGNSDFPLYKFKNNSLFIADCYFIFGKIIEQSFRFNLSNGLN
jgi:hypothetical protein